VGLLLTLGLWGCAAAPTAETPAAAARPVDVLVVRRGWHVDIGFAAADLAPPLAQMLADFPGARYLVFGFGDRRYLLRHGGGSAALAALWPGAGLILVTGLSASPAAAFGPSHVINVPVTQSQARDAQRFIWHSIRKTDGSLEVLAPGPYEGSRYFDATERYHAFNTCNTWVARTLSEAGLAVRPAGVLLAGQVWRQARRLPGATVSAHDLPH